MKTNKIGAAIVLGGLTAGTLDFMAAMGIYHLSAQTVGKSIACGWFGKSAMQGGWDVAVSGIASHYAILLGAAALYVLAAAAEPALRRRAWIAGPLFGLGVYLVMHFVIVPLSAAHGASQPKRAFRRGVLEPPFPGGPADCALVPSPAGQGLMGRGKREEMARPERFERPTLRFVV
jgi:hypothetical protein